MEQVRVAVILAGIGRVQRGAEAAFLHIAEELARYPDMKVTLFGSGEVGLPDLPRHIVACRPREKFEGWLRVPTLRNECQYEEFSYAWNLAKSGSYRSTDFDVVISCSYPWINWYLRWTGRHGGPLHVYVTQNGDWPCQAVNQEFRSFRCDGLVCTNPIFYQRQQSRYRATLIPNGVDADLFRPRSSGDPDALPELRDARVGADQKVVLMVSALIESKHVDDGVRAVAQVPDVFFVLAGDGPERGSIEALAEELLPGRHLLLGSVTRERMPALFRRADAFIHMSRDEPSALVYLEAAASGLPLVVHDNEVTRWTLGDAALFTDASDPARSAACLREALDPRRASELGAEARQRVLQGWTWEALGARYREFLRELVETSPPSRLCRGGVA